MSDERKETEELLKALDTLEIVYREASVENPEPTLKAIQQIRNLIFQKNPKIDKKYVDGKARELHHELYGEWNENSKHGASFRDIKNSITQVVRDAKGKT